MDLATWALVIAAVAGTLVAWRQLHLVAVQARATLLLALDERWESTALRPCRDAMQNVLERLLTGPMQEWAGLPLGQREQHFRDLCAAEMQRLRIEDKPCYNQIMQVAGLLETVGFVARKKYLPVADVVELLGGSIEGAGDLLCAHLRKFQEEELDEELYEHFLWLVTQAEEHARGTSVARRPVKRKRKGRSGVNRP